jgi:23S rRNA (pseudouridine1915-N3)-methyltransferase
MRIRLIQVGKNQENFIGEGCAFFERKLKHYCQLEVITLPSLKNASTLSREEIKKQEGEQLLKIIDAKALICLLDEHGKTFDSVDFSRQIEQWAVAGRSQIDFIIGGAFGFSESVYQKSNFKLSLSQMTFSHQLIRIVFLEQLYRAFTILKNEPYHHV